MKIKFKLPIIFTSVITIILTVIFLTTTLLIYRDATNNYITNLTNTSKSVEIQIVNLLDKTLYDYIKTASKKNSNILASLNDSVSKKILTLKEARELFLDNIIKQNKNNEGFTIITDNNGVIIYHINSELIGKKFKYMEMINSKSSDIYMNLKASDDPSVFYNKYYFSSWNWHVFSCINYTEVYSILDFDSFNSTINNIKVGTTGYPYIISDHGLAITHPNNSIRYNSIYNLEDERGFRFISYLLNSNDNLVEYLWKDPDGSVRAKVAYSAKIPNTNWVIISGGYKDDFYSTSNLVQRLLLGITIVSIFISIIITIIFSRSLTKPIDLLNNAIKDISEGDGDLTKTIKINSKDELMDMADNLNIFISKLKGIIIDIQSVANKTISIKDGLKDNTINTTVQIEDIESNLNSINQSVENLGSSVENTNSNVIEITNSINTLGDQIISQNAMIEESSAAITQMISSIDSVADITAKKQAITSQLVETTHRGVNVVESSMNSVTRISEQLEDISSMATVISNIASETNILAMNAAIEAAHAGEAGKGFAVVAEEIRKLAESSDDNSNRIKDLLSQVNESMITTSSLSKETISSISEIEAEIKDFVLAFDEIKQSTGELRVGGKEMTEAIEVLRDISIHVKESSDLINSLTSGVTEAMNSTTLASKDIVSQVEMISTNADKISDSMDKVNVGSKELTYAGDDLENQVNKFKV